METNTTEKSYTYEVPFVDMLHVTFVVVLSGIFLLGSTGNGLVIWFVAFRMKKAVNSVWFLSLAVADFTFSVFLPFTITYEALGHWWPFGTFMCKLNTFILLINLSASILQLTVISIDRCISVVFPVWCQNHRTVRLAVKGVLAVWILSLLLSLSYLINTTAFYFDKYMMCFTDKYSDVGELIHKAQVVIRFITVFITPFTIIIFCYTVIFLRVRRSHKRTPSKAFKMIGAVIASFFFCWFPYHVFSFMDAYLRIDSHDLSLAIKIGLAGSSILAYSNSCVNPLLYVFIGRDFKEKCWSSLPSAFHRGWWPDGLKETPSQPQLFTRSCNQPDVIVLFPIT